MNAREHLTVEQALDAAPGMLTAEEIEQATGLDEKAVRAELRRIAGLGNLEHVPGRGRGIKSRYGLIARLGTGAIGSAPSQSAEIPLVEQNQDVAEGFDDNADPLPGDDLTTRAVKLAVRNHNKRLESQDAEFSLTGVIADIRAAVGDKTGKIMLSELAEHIRARFAELDATPAALRAELKKADDELAEIQAALAGRVYIVGDLDELPSAAQCATRAAAVIDQLTSANRDHLNMIAIASETLAPLASGDIDTSDMDLHEIAERVAAGHADLTARLENKDSELREQAALVVKLRMQLSEAYAERDEIRLRKDSPPADQPVGYLVRATKRKPRTLQAEDKAREAALGAIRAGAPRAEVFALMPVGQAKRGAEWRDA